MFKTIKNFNWIILFSFLCIFLGIFTFLTFINEGFIPLNNKNLQTLLIIDVVLLIIFFYLIFKGISKIYNEEQQNKMGSSTNIKYITFFSLFTILPSFLVAVFSLLIFNFGIQKYFDDKIKLAVNNSYDVSKSYLEESEENVKSDIILMSVGLNRSSRLFYDDIEKFKKIIRTEKILRRIDDVYLIDSYSNILLSDIISESNTFIEPSEKNFNDVLKGDPVFVDNSYDRTTVMIKINSLVDTYLYISRNIDTKILRYLNETEKAVSFYYSVENSQTGIKITFAMIYIILVTLLLFLSTVIAISFARKLTKPIINLISASEKISSGFLDTKVPDIETDQEFKKLNTNFNNMIDRLKRQQEKLLTTERYSAWETVARKLAHEIKNPLTPIQLSIDSLREKYANKFNNDNLFENYLQTIKRQINDIEKLVTEFSNFARMPSPIFKKVNIIDVIKRSVDLFKFSSKNKINIKYKNNHIILMADEEQLYRVFVNLIKNSNETIEDKTQKNHEFKGKIDIEILSNNDYIFVYLTDNGTGVLNKKEVMNPYFTTKEKGTGLGLPIVSKIINEHSGEIVISDNKSENGTTIQISLPKINE